MKTEGVHEADVEDEQGEGHADSRGIHNGVSENMIRLNVLVQLRIA